MADKIMLNFRCPAELLDVIDTLGQERHPSETTKHGCDRTKTLLDIVRAGIEALSQGLAVLPVLDKVVRYSKTDDVSDIESRFAAIEERLGKMEGLSDSSELPKPDVGVAEIELQTTMGNLQAENEILRADYAKLLESSTHVTNKFREEVQQLRSQLETEHADREEIEAEFSELKQNSAPAATLSGKPTPDAATILSQLRARRKKSKTDLADLEAILEILES
jgi:predicted RNase H-like nuclease (RuvC/YqgF family)